MRKHIHNELIRFYCIFVLGDPDGDTPLLVCEIPEIFEILVAAGADPNTTNAAGHNLFSISVEDENDVMVNYLVSRGLGPGGVGLNISFGVADEVAASSLLEAMDEGEEEEDGDNRDEL